jgi:CubicO group peptidase (beta-lactamase class C family)
MARKKSKSKVWPVTKGFLWTLFIVLVLFNLYLAISNRWYFYSGVAKTYLVGEKGPTIYDLDKFAYATIDAAPSASALVYHPNQRTLNEAEQKYLDEWLSTSFLVMRNDTVLLEYYTENHDEQTVSNSFSAGKSVVSMLIAIAVEDGFIGSIDEPVASYLSEFNNTEMKNISIRHLLTMSSGLEWAESASNPFSDNAEAYYGWNLRKLVLSKKPVRKPGEFFDYTSMSTQILSYVLEAATKQKMDRYFQERLWRRIGSENDAFWSKDSENGDLKAYCCMYLSTRDYARLGLLILNNGVHKGEQIIPEWYMREAFVPDKSLNTKQDIPNERYGLHWWVAPGDGDTLKYARGINGQYILIVPSKDLVVVRTGHKRTPDATEVGMLSKEQIGPFKHQIGHPEDVFQYLKIAFRIAESAK